MLEVRNLTKRYGDFVAVRAGDAAALGGVPKASCSSGVFFRAGIVLFLATGRRSVSRRLS